MTNKNNTVSVLRNKSLINFEGESFLGQVGIDSRIFKAFDDAKISVGTISQQAIENGVSVLVDEKDAEKAEQCLKAEFKTEIDSGIVERIYKISNLCVLCVFYNDSYKIVQALAKNKVEILITQVSAGEQINMVIRTEQIELAERITKSIVEGTAKVVNLIIVGPGQVGKTLIDQIQSSSKDILERKNIALKIVSILNSRKMILNKDGFDDSWQNQLENSDLKSDVKKLIDWTNENQLENLILVDNTASKDFVENYDDFAENGYDLVSSNKIYNTLSINRYRELRNKLAKNNNSYLYETNVGAGLPLIDTIKLLHLSGENITRIKGVFSGSLSYIFNNFSVREDKFSTIIQEAMEKGFTEPDPREDLSGNDVARKLLILARELDLVNEFEDINIQNLIPSHLLEIPKAEFLDRLDELNEHYCDVKNKQSQDYVLRYVGDLHGDLTKDKGILDVKLVSVPTSSSLGQVKGSDSIFEIYTESYGENPIVIMGAGAGAQVTARGVFGDVLRQASKFV